MGVGLGLSAWEAWLLGEGMRPQNSRDDSWREKESLDGTEVPVPASSSIRVFPSPLSSVSRLDLAFWHLSPGLNNPVLFYIYLCCFFCLVVHFHLLKILPEVPTQCPPSILFLCHSICPTPPWPFMYRFHVLHQCVLWTETRLDPPRASLGLWSLTHGRFYLLCSPELT